MTVETFSSTTGVQLASAFLQDLNAVIQNNQTAIIDKLTVLRERVIYHQGISPSIIYASEKFFKTVKCIR